MSRPLPDILKRARIVDEARKAFLVDEVPPPEPKATGKDKLKLLAAMSPEQLIQTWQAGAKSKRYPTYVDLANFFKDAFDPTKHARDPKGKTTGGQFSRGAGGTEGSGVKKIDPKLTLKKTNRRAWNGFSVDLKKAFSKLATGELGENIALAYTQQIEKNKDAKVYGLTPGEKAVDMIGDHMLIEVKAGLASNDSKSFQWRTTYGEPGEAEKAWRKTASKEAIAKLGEKRKAEIIKRKNELLERRSKDLGVRLQPRTVASIINPDTKTADVYVFKGFHSRIGWKSDEAQKAYVGSFVYGD